jgi:hypothetical protein
MLGVDGWSTLVGSSFTYKYETRLEVPARDKRSSLFMPCKKDHKIENLCLYRKTFYDRSKFYSIGKAL